MKKIITIVLGVLLHCSISVGSQNTLISPTTQPTSPTTEINQLTQPASQPNQLLEDVKKDPARACKLIEDYGDTLDRLSDTMKRQTELIKRQHNVIIKQQDKIRYLTTATGILSIVSVGLLIKIRLGSNQ